MTFSSRTNLKFWCPAGPGAVLSPSWQMKMPAGKYVAETSDLRWNGGGTELVFAVHTASWRQKARDTFTNITTGPVFVQNSKDPFLAWDDLRRMGTRRSVGALG